MQMRAAGGTVQWIATFAAAVLMVCGSVGCSREAPWRSEYFENSTLAGQPHFTTNHRVIDFNWGTRAPLESWVEDDFSIRWETCMRVERLARITFRLASDDGSRLYINDDKIIDNWGEHGFDVIASRTIVLNPGMYHVRVDYFEASGLAGIQLATNAQPAEAVEMLPLPAATNGTDGGARRCEGAGES